MQKIGILLVSLFGFCIFYNAKGIAYPTSQEFYEQFTAPLAELVKKDKQIKIDAYNRWVKNRNHKRIMEFGGYDAVKQLEEKIEKGLADPASHPTFSQYLPLGVVKVLFRNPILYVYNIVNFQHLFNKCDATTQTKNFLELKAQYNQLNAFNNNATLEDLEDLDKMSFDEQDKLFSDEPIIKIVQCNAADLARDFAIQYNITKATFKNRYFNPAYYGTKENVFQNIYERFVNWLYPFQETTDVE